MKIFYTLINQLRGAFEFLTHKLMKRIVKRSHEFLFSIFLKSYFDFFEKCGFFAKYKLELKHLKHESDCQSERDR